MSYKEQIMSKDKHPSMFSPQMEAIVLVYYPSNLLRLVFTSDRVVVGVVIRSVERCDPVKIKPTESEAEHCKKSASAYDSVAYDLVKTALSESQAEEED